jgi:predicted peptidase
MKRILNLVLIVAAAAWLSGCASTRQATIFSAGQHAQSFSEEIRKTVSAGYWIYLPDGYTAEKRDWPLVLFLHGSGERGTDLELVKRNGPPKLVEQGKQYPFILVSPQCSESDEEWPTDMLNALLDQIEATYSVDRTREYVTGLSMGGQATWKLAAAYPERFAAIIPICGGGHPRSACMLKNVPIWVFHGKKDPVVPIEDNEIMVNAVKNCGGNVKFTVYPDAGHDAWTETYNNPDVYEWMLSQSRKKPQR